MKYSMKYLCEINIKVNGVGGQERSQSLFIGRPGLPRSARDAADVMAPRGPRALADARLEGQSIGYVGADLIQTDPQDPALSRVERAQHLLLQRRDARREVVQQLQTFVREDKVTCAAIGLIDRP